MQTHLVPKIMHQNLAVILWQFYLGQNGFIVLVPGPTCPPTAPFPPGPPCPSLRQSSCSCAAKINMSRRFREEAWRRKEIVFLFA